MFDELAKTYFETKADYKRGIQLLRQYNVAKQQYRTWSEIEENFLTNLDDHEDHLLELAMALLRERVQRPEGTGKERIDLSPEAMKQLADFFQTRSTTSPGSTLWWATHPRVLDGPGNREYRGCQGRLESSIQPSHGSPRIASHNSVTGCVISDVTGDIFPFALGRVATGKRGTSACRQRRPVPPGPCASHSCPWTPPQVTGRHDAAPAAGSISGEATIPAGNILSDAMRGTGVPAIRAAVRRHLRAPRTSR